MKDESADDVGPNEFKIGNTKKLNSTDKRRIYEEGTDLAAGICT